MKGGDKTILLVDDSDQDLLLISTALGEHACGKIVPAESVDAAIKYLQNSPPPALVLLDIQMPLKDGFELLAWIRARKEDWHRVPIVMLTTSHDYVEIRRAYDLGANSFLVKPTGYEELKTLLKQACEYWLGPNRTG
jgi:CheY-like chemotaxis protein